MTGDAAGSHPGARARAPLAPTLLWALVTALAALVVLRARYTADLSAFLPRAPTATQQLLVEQLRDGVASRLLILAIEGGAPSERATVSARLTQSLEHDSRFLSVSNGAGERTAGDRQFLFEHRYRLSPTVRPERFTAAGLRAAIQDTLDLLASPAGLMAKPLVPHDPTGELVSLLDDLSGAQPPNTVAGVWASRAGDRALILAQTRVAGSDTDGQERAIEAIRRYFAAALATGAARAPPALTLRMTGPGVFSVESRATIEREVTRLSIIGGAFVIALLLLVYRSLAALCLGLVPVITGALVGVAAVALGFKVVHGLTLGFGVTLIGEAVDYSVYFFVQAQGGAPRPGAAARGAWTSTVWPIIRLGMLTSVCGFASLLPSQFPGLAQLGLYSIAGLVAAALVTRFVLPLWLPRAFELPDLAPLGRHAERLLRALRPLRGALLMLPALAAWILITHRDTLWNRELSALSPVPRADQQLDAELRAATGAPDVSTLIVVSRTDEQAALRAAEALEPGLRRLTETGELGGFETPARYLPSVARQELRRASLPAPDELRSRLQVALAGSPLPLQNVQPFLADVAAARSAPLLSRHDLVSTSFGTAYDALMLHRGGEWHALLPLRPPATSTGRIDLARVRATLERTTAMTGIVVLDLKSAADQLYSGYLREAARLSLAGLAALVLLLSLTLRSLRRVARVILPLALAVMTVAAALVLTGRWLTILHMIGMLLIFAIGSNYALFFDARAGEASTVSAPLTIASLIIANAATVFAFGVLAFSSVPVLAALGATVAPGALLALLFAALLTSG